MSRWRRAVPVGLLILAVGCAVAAIYGKRHAVSDALRQLSPASVVLAFGFGLAATAMPWETWRCILAPMGGHVPRRESARLFFVSQLGKYVPGSLWPVVAQMQFGRRYGIPRRTMLTANVLTIAVGATVGLMVAIAALPFSSASVLRRYWWAVLVLPLLLVALHPRVVPGLVNYGLRLLRREPLTAAPTGRSMVAGSAWMALSWLLYGGHIYTMLAGLGRSGMRPLVLATGAFALATSAGLVAIAAPAGAGVRDVIMVATLATAIPAGAALTITLLSRAMLVLADLVWAGVTALLGRGRTSPLPSADSPTSDSSLT